MKLIPAETTILLLAAGQSSRMGTADKLLQTIRDQPLLGRVARMCLDAGVAKVAAVLRPGDDRRRAVLPAGVEIVENPEFAEGMASSIRAGLKAVARDTRAVVVVLADMPDVSASDIRALVAAFDPDQGKTICRANAARTVRATMASANCKETGMMAVVRSAEPSGTERHTHLVD